MARRNFVIYGITTLSLAGVFAVPPIAQPLSFHQFADTRELWGIPNAANVLSNLPFLLIGCYGLRIVASAKVTRAVRMIYGMLFVGVLLTGLGSAYYHWRPNNDTLVWDRIPMTIVFMSFLSATITELVKPAFGYRLLLPLVAVGIGSVCWWHYTETLGRGDLRLYMWVQFYPMIAIPLLLWLYYEPKVKLILPCLVWIVGWYIIAKLFERFDFQVYHFIGFSGHSIKHLAAAISTWYFVRLFKVKYINGVVLSVDSSNMDVIRH